MNLRDVDENLAMKDFYGKAIENSGQNEQVHMIRFTSVPSEVDAYFQSHRQHAEKLKSTESSWNPLITYCGFADNHENAEILS